MFKNKKKPKSKQIAINVFQSTFGPQKKRPGYKYSKVKWFFHWIYFFLFEKSLSLLMSIQTCFKGFKERWKPSLPEMNRKGWGFTWGKCNTVDSFFTRVLDSVIQRFASNQKIANADYFFNSYNKVNLSKIQTMFYNQRDVLLWNLPSY